MILPDVSRLVHRRPSSRGGDTYYYLGLRPRTAKRSVTTIVILPGPGACRVRLVTARRIPIRLHAFARAAIQGITQGWTG